MFEYSRWGRYFAQVAGGLEELLITELQELGAEECKAAYRGVHFSAGPETLYRIVYCSRLATRILAPLLRFDCHSDRYLYKTASGIAWEQLFGPEHTFAIVAHVNNSALRHSRFAAQRLKDAIADYFRAGWNKRPSVDTRTPDIWLSLHIENNKALISVDCAGGSMHRRGYRSAGVEAPMQETLAAALVRLSGWRGSRPFYDPMCGSGTLLCEAFMLAGNIPAGFLRERFGFERLPDFQAALWHSVRQSARSAMRAVPAGLIAGSDIDGKAIAAAAENLRRLPGAEAVELQRRDFRDIATLEGACIVCNPPYGIRLESTERVAALYKELGDFLKQRCTGAEAYLYCGDRALIGAIGLRPAWKKPLVNGALDGRLCKFELYRKNARSEPDSPVRSV